MGASDPTEGSYVTVTGWGRTDNGISSDVLREVTLPVMSNNECRMYFNNVMRGHICTSGKDSKGSCNVSKSDIE